jgi:RimJ/RimL family protein N-acetyltransferase
MEAGSLKRVAGHVLETERLVLRRLRPADLEPLHALYRDPEIRRYYPDGTRTLEETGRSWRPS